MKLLIIPLLLVVSICKGQDLKKPNRVYKFLDSALIYDNAAILIYKNKTGATVRDTVFNRGVDIAGCENVEIYQGIKLKKRTIN